MTTYFPSYRARAARDGRALARSNARTFRRRARRLRDARPAAASCRRSDSPSSRPKAAPPSYPSTCRAVSGLSGSESSLPGLERVRCRPQRSCRRAVRPQRAHDRAAGRPGREDARRAWRPRRWRPNLPNWNRTRLGTKLCGGSYRDQTMIRTTRLAARSSRPATRLAGAPGPSPRLQHGRVPASHTLRFRYLAGPAARTCAPDRRSASRLPERRDRRSAWPCAHRPRPVPGSRSVPAVASTRSEPR